MDPLLKALYDPPIYFVSQWADVPEGESFFFLLDAQHGVTVSFDDARGKSGNLTLKGEVLYVTWSFFFIGDDSRRLSL